MEQLTDKAIRWAVAHITRYGDTDIFPRPFEHQAMAASMDIIVPHLRSCDLSRHRPSASIQMMMPKEVGGFRAATQLDPVDAIIHAGLAYESADAIERLRGPLESSPSCAYRVDRQPDGQLFGATAGWDAFHAKSQTHARSGRFSHVVLADISDFYNQISHHRANHALASAGLEPSRCAAVEAILSRLAGEHHSQGLPVGPSYSILLAEAVLVDVDNYLTRQGVAHCRYVDDFRIFCRSREEGVRALLELSTYLFVSHRLSLQSHKTRLMRIEEFAATELTDPAELETVASRKRLAELVVEARAARYRRHDAQDGDERDAVEEDAIAAERKADTVRAAIESLCDCVLGAPALPIGMARYMLRRATEYRSRSILERVLCNAERFLPVIRDLCSYFVKVFERTNPKRVGDTLRDIALASDYKAVPLVQYWVLDTACRAPELIAQNDLWSVLNASDMQIRPRMTALAARAYGQVEWVRSRKQNWQNGSPWEQRAILFAASILPDEEKRHWLRHVAEDTSPDLRAIALWSINQ